MNEMARQIIVDVDPGTDDYLALLILFFAEKLLKVKILALICSNGNVSTDYTCKNLVRLLEIVNRTDVPVYRGASHQFIPLTEKVIHFFKEDGFGNVKFDKDPDMSIIRKEPAAVALGNLILQNPNQITIIALAPLTDIAIATRMYGGFADAVQEIWIMGGNYDAVGNNSQTAEFNFYLDPEAASIVIGSIPKKIYIVSWESTLVPRITTSWLWNEFALKQKPEIKAFIAADKVIYKGKVLWQPCDAFLAGVFVEPNMITQTADHTAGIELNGIWTRGQMILDRKNKIAPHNNITIITGIQKNMFQKLLLML